MQDVDESTKECDAFYDELIILITKILALLEKQKAADNILWIINVKKNFIPIIKMIKEVKQYKQKRIMPLI